MWHSNETQHSHFLVVLEDQLVVILLHFKQVLPACKLQSALCWTNYAISVLVTCFKGVSTLSSLLLSFSFIGCKNANTNISTNS